VDRAALVPAPAHRIPILCGGLSTPAYRRGARRGDGFIFTADLEETALPAWREVRAYMETYERDVEGFRAEYHAMRRDYGGLALSDLLRTLETWEANGGTHASVMTMGMGFSTVDDHLQHLEKLAHALGRDG
jgi:alkanesulfonate monooxygenase SsuD/methylene tetrahydromethanopterin reductase-like flavin-dependent oxidoreductase (luciferase family)